MVYKNFCFVLKKRGIALLKSKTKTMCFETNLCSGDLWVKGKAKYLKVYSADSLVTLAESTSTGAEGTGLDCSNLRANRSPS